MMIKPLPCRDCGAVFDGYQNAKYCPACRARRDREHNRRQKRDGPARPLGSTDTCAVCGREYTVTGGRQKYCPDCRLEAYLAVDRAGGLKYYRDVKPAHSAGRHKPAEIPCAVCGRPFAHGGTKRKTCGPECRRKYCADRHRERRQIKK